ncbi:MAG: hypothetical protein LBC61_07420 [Candidatus Peribacteria bacterium]|jgi:hypothetical protein|nr:hypothetical protein [Candidatus Peribacteria bacterium]
MDNAIDLARRNPLITQHSEKRVHKAGKDYPVIDQFAFSKFVNEYVKNIV